MSEENRPDPDLPAASEAVAEGERPPEENPGLASGTSTSFSELMLLYKDWRMAKILLIGIISGFPWILIASMMSLWLKAEGLSRTGIGLFGLVFTIYAINLIWAPLIDSVKIPFLSRLGQRRSWIVLMQACIFVLMVLMFFVEPKSQLAVVSVLAFLIALCSATQDVAVDALRIELIGRLETGKVGAGSAMATSGWWIGFGGFGAVGLVVAEYFEMSLGIERYWQMTYLAMSLVVVLCVVLLLAFVREPERKPAAELEGGAAAAAARFVRIFYDPVKSFVVNYGLRIGITILVLVFLFKIGEAFLGRMSIIFYKEVGFSKSDIALYSKGYGTLALCVFAVLGSFINARFGLYKGLLVGGIAMASTNLLFAWLAVDPSEWLFAVAVVTDQFTTAVSTVALVAFLSQLCERAYAATQYAALASIGNLSRTTLAAASGAMVDGLGGNWSLFFVITTLMVLPSLALLIYVRKDIAGVMSGQTTKML